MTTTVAAADAAHFLSLVPHLLGFAPARSLVVVPFAGKTSLGALRIDLPTGSPRQLDGVASNVVGMVCRIPGADGLVAVAYTDAAIDGRLPEHDLVAAIDRAADACGLRVVDLLTVAADGWGSHADRHLPPTGRPLDEIARSAASVATSIADAPEVVDDLAAGAELPRRSAAERRKVGRAARELSAAIDAVCGMPLATPDASVSAAAVVAAGELDDLPRLYESALRESAEELEPMRAALLIWCLARPSLRDIALVQWATDLEHGDEALEAQQEWEQTGDYPDRLGRIMWGDADRPDPARLEAALALVRHVAALAPRRERPGPLALCAWLSWALGRSTHADLYARRALEIDPDHGLSEILCAFVQAGHLPDWAFRRPGHVR